MYITEVLKMTNTNATSFRKNIFSMLEQTIKFNEPVNISTKEGNAVLISENDYNNLLATLEIYNNPLLHEKVLKGMNEKEEECVSENEVEW